MLGRLQAQDLAVQPGLPRLQVVEQSHQVGFAGAGEEFVRLLTTNHRDRPHTDQHTDDGHRPLPALHALNTLRRIAAALAKIRMARTTTTPVDIWAPTPS